MYQNSVRSFIKKIYNFFYTKIAFKKCVLIEHTVLLEHCHIGEPFVCLIKKDNHTSLLVISVWYYLKIAYKKNETPVVAFLRFFSVQDIVVQ